MLLFEVERYFSHLFGVDILRQSLYYKRFAMQFNTVQLFKFNQASIYMI